MNNIEKVKHIIACNHDKTKQSLWITDSAEQIDALYNSKSDSFKRFRAEKGGYYWYITPESNIRQSEELFFDLDNYRYSIGNYFETEEQAKLAQKKAILLQKYKDIIKEKNKGVEFDWKETTQSKYRIYWNNNRDKCEVTDNCTNYITDKELYFLNKSTFDSIRSQMTDEEIRLALGFGGEE